MRRAGQDLRALLSLAAVAMLAAAAPAASAQVVVGVSDNNYFLFAQPRFKQLHVPTVRDGVDWNVAVTKDPRKLQMARAWIAEAAADHATPLISFGGVGNYVPTVAQYTTAVKAFIRDSPQVKLFTAWDEPDWMYRSLYRKPALAAAYFNALVQACRDCTVVAGDVHLPASVLGGWLRAYKTGLRYRPAAWALHDYIDIRTHSTAQLRVLAANTSAPIWLDEVAGTVRRGHWSYPNQSLCHGISAGSRGSTITNGKRARVSRGTQRCLARWAASGRPSTRSSTRSTASCRRRYLRWWRGWARRGRSASS